MISDIALLEIYNQYNNTARKNDYVILPFINFLLLITDYVNLSGMHQAGNINICRYGICKLFR